MDVEGVLVSHVFVEFLLPAPSLLLLVEFLLRGMVSLENQHKVNYSERFNEEAKAKLNVVQLSDRTA